MSYEVGEPFDLSGATFDNLIVFTDKYGITMYYDQFDRPYTDFTVDSSQFNSNVPGTYAIYVT